MIRLLKIDILKMVNYRTFWIMNILYAILIISIPTTVIEFLKWLNKKGNVVFDGKVDIMKIPVLHFPDIWHNITYVFLFLKFFLAILVIITVSNEFTYKTIRQNIIDGMTKIDFVISKMLTILLLCLGSTLLVFITGMLTGLIYTPEIVFSEIFEGIQFLFAYFLDVFAYCMFAFLLTVLLRRAGLTIALLALSVPIEYTITSSLPHSLSGSIEYFPLHAINNLIESPFGKYFLLEIQDFVSPISVCIVLAYIAFFIVAIHFKLNKNDI